MCKAKLAKSQGIVEFLELIELQQGIKRLHVDMLMPTSKVQILHTETATGLRIVFYVDEEPRRSDTVIVSGLETYQVTRIINPHTVSQVNYLLIPEALMVLSDA